jgi:KUP system potassium uptake protein
MHRRKYAVWLTVASLGVVFGDIGTSPLYALKLASGIFSPSSADFDLFVTGLISLIIWTVTAIVSVKYLLFITRANNSGEGGIMALVALLSRGRTKKHLFAFAVLGLIGVSLYYGDSVITPAISVLSAVEGISVTAPELSYLVVPLAAVILAGLFLVQRRGTGPISRVFGPIMVVWFLTIAAGGLGQVVQNPAILAALSPLTALQLVMAHPLASLLLMSVVTLAITGAESLYADMGHFGRQPVGAAWFLVVFPALALCYLGEGALVLAHPDAISNSFYLMFPEAVRLHVLILATLATLIASQAVISGAFSLTRQAVQLGYLPRLTIKQTSGRLIGQVYVPAVNLLLFVLVLTIVFAFGSSTNLASAYGVAVSGTLAIDTILFLAVMHRLWNVSILATAVFGIIFLGIDGTLIASNIWKIADGGWLTLAIASVTATILFTWTYGRLVTSREIHASEEPLLAFSSHLKQNSFTQKLPGTAIYIGHHPGMTPSALMATVKDFHELHQKVIVAYVKISHKAHVEPKNRASYASFGDTTDGFAVVTLTFGFHDLLNIPRALELARSQSPELGFDLDTVAYFVSLNRVVVSKRHTLPGILKNLYALLYRNAENSSEYYGLPLEQTTEMQSLVRI